jgi:hypothetical protein
MDKLKKRDNKAKNTQTFPFFVLNEKPKYLKNLQTGVILERALLNSDAPVAQDPTRTIETPYAKP